MLEKVFILSSNKKELKDRLLLGPKLLLVMGFVKLVEKNCVQMPSVGEQNAN